MKLQFTNAYKAKQSSLVAFTLMVPSLNFIPSRLQRRPYVYNLNNVSVERSLMWLGHGLYARVLKHLMAFDDIKLVYIWKWF